MVESVSPCTSLNAPFCLELNQRLIKREHRVIRDRVAALASWSGSLSAALA